jgi:hypothetical protein
METEEDHGKEKWYTKVWETIMDNVIGTKDKTITKTKFSEIIMDLNA